MPNIAQQVISLGLIENGVAPRNNVPQQASILKDPASRSSCKSP